MYSKLLHWKVSWLNLRLTSRFLYFLPTNAFTYIVETMSGIIKRGHKKDQRNFYSLSHVPKQIMMALKRVQVLPRSKYHQFAGIRGQIQSIYISGLSLGFLERLNYGS